MATRQSQTKDQTVVAINGRTENRLRVYLTGRPQKTYSPLSVSVSAEDADAVATLLPSQVAQQKQQQQQHLRWTWTSTAKCSNYLLAWIAMGHTDTTAVFCNKLNLPPNQTPPRTHRKSRMHFVCSISVSAISHNWYIPIWICNCSSHIYDPSSVIIPRNQSINGVCISITHFCILLLLCRI